MDPSRRDFLRRTGSATLGMAAAQVGLEKFALAAALARQPAAADYRALVCVFLDGGNDGNNLIVPLDPAGYAAYSSVRSASGLAGVLPGRSRRMRACAARCDRNTLAPLRLGQ